MSAASAALPRRPGLLGARGGLLLLGVLLAVPAAHVLGLVPRELLPRGAGLETARAFLAEALHPSLRHGAAVPEGAASYGRELLEALGRTVALALAAMSLVLLLGLPLGVLASSAFWEVRRAGERVPAAARVARWTVRLGLVLARSVHELLWALLLLAALGLTPGAALLALAVPYTGILAKVTSELLDEAPRRGAEGLLAAGAPPSVAFLFGVLPRALPDVLAYAFYRLECSVRAAAVLGFFGVPTLGYHLLLAFRGAQYRQAWSVLYLLLGLVLALEAWSALLRRRVVA